MKEKLIKLISLIENLDFTQDNNIQITQALNDAVRNGVKPFFFFTIPVKTPILRARGNKNANSPFWFSENLSFRREVYDITEYQRATIASHTCFYGTIGISKEDITNTGLRVVMAEALPDKMNFKGVYTISVWTFEESLRCLTIIDDYYKNSNNPILNDVYKKYCKYLGDHPELKDELVKFNKILACEFKKTVRINDNKKDHLLYQVSGTVGNNLLLHNFGVVYPTAKANNYSHALNVAIPWRFADAKLKLNYAGMFNVDVKNDIVTLNGIKECKIIQSNINDPKNDKNQDILSGKYEMAWRDINSEKYNQYF